ncbi:hypothetical protein GCM10023067_35290 [Aminobacter aganoensis]
MHVGTNLSWQGLPGQAPVLPGRAQQEPEPVQPELAQEQAPPVRAQGQALPARGRVPVLPERELALSQPGVRPVLALLRSGRRCSKPRRRAARR